MKKVSINSDLSCVAIVSENLREFCALHKLPDELIDIVDIMLVEAVNNVIEHAYNCEPDHFVEVEYHLVGNLLRIYLRDTGKYYSAYEDISAVEIPNENDLPEGGWGIGLINSIADRVTYSRQNEINELFMEKRLM